MRGVADIGAGTGELVDGLAPYFGRAILVEPDDAMIGEARKRLAPMDVPIEFCCSRAEEFEFPSGKFDVATFGNSFHWLDQDAVLSKLRGALASPSVVVVVNSTSPFRSSASWQREVIGIIESAIGQRRRAGTAGYFPDQPFTQEESLERGGFSVSAEIAWMHEQSWGAESYVGFLQSTSFASDVVLGHRRDEVHRAIRDLFSSSSDGQLIDEMEFHALVAVKDLGQAE
ncbi:MAG: class I SAM-dependent methyltransferase [bacterium]|nr:class I SAM-dependent methyltransferase [bacterium]